MSRIGNKNRKKHYEDYKMGGHRELNKGLKKLRLEKRLARFAKRKEEGKHYKYDKDNALDTGSNVNSKRGIHTPYAKLTSLMRKLDNELEREIETEKKLARKANSKEKLAIN